MIHNVTLRDRKLDYMPSISAKVNVKCSTIGNKKRAPARKICFLQMAF
jgi:hypothetical protein